MEVINTIGRRKCSVARIYMTPGTGKIVVNKRDYKEYFPTGPLQYIVNQPLQVANAEGKWDIKANLDGGGITGQAQALRMAIARALWFPHARPPYGRAQETRSAQGSQTLPVQQTLTVAA